MQRIWNKANAHKYGRFDLNLVECLCELREREREEIATDERINTNSPENFMQKFLGRWPIEREGEGERREHPASNYTKNASAAIQFRESRIISCLNIQNDRIL